MVYDFRGQIPVGGWVYTAPLLLRLDSLHIFSSILQEVCQLSVANVYLLNFFFVH